MDVPPHDEKKLEGGGDAPFLLRAINAKESNPNRYATAGNTAKGDE